MTMIGPLWSFFKLIKDKGPVPLAIDQYTYFVQALSGMHSMPLDSPKDLLNFTKIFWLNHRSFEDQYEYYFNQLVNWEQIIQVSKKNEGLKENSYTTSDTSRGENQELNDENTHEENSQIEKNNEASLLSEMVDFELVLTDIKSDQAEDALENQSLYDTNFNLSDNVIMPFKGRKFSQRLRRRVETSDQVVSDELDLPLMIEEFIQTGFIDEIKYELEDASYSNVVFLADRLGSMLAYEYLEKHFKVSLAQIPHCNFEHYSFYNLPELSDHFPHYKLNKADTKNVYLETKDHNWNQNTWFILLSDAGAHSGLVHKERLKGSLKFWRYLKSISNNVHWVNPVPFEYLNDCTAKRLQMIIPMVYPLQKELDSMIKPAST